jgi:hypothetical protein
VFFSGLHPSANVAPLSCSGGTAGHQDIRFGGLHLFQERRLSSLLRYRATFGQMPASFTRFRPNHTLPLYAHETFDLGVPPTARTRPHSAARPPGSSNLPGYWIYHNRDDSISFGTQERDYFGWLPAEITRAVPESVINTIASMVCHAHRKGRKEAYNYLKQFVLEQMRVPDWPHYPMNDLRRMTPPPLPPTHDT